ncbi:MAG: AMP-binding enzyme, partial [Solirubrobacteraceae bacterium]
GVRMGTSEIYRVVLDLDEVLDALVVDLPAQAVPRSASGLAKAGTGLSRPAGTDGWMELFVVLRDGAALDDRLAGEIRRRMREDCSPRHVPDEIRRIDAVPRTLSGKALEVPVKRILMGVPAAEAASRESLANPEALDHFVALAAERG